MKQSDANDKRHQGRQRPQRQNGQRRVDTLKNSTLILGYLAAAALSTMSLGSLASFVVIAAKSLLRLMRL